MNGFKFDFSKIFWGLTEPPPQTPPPAFFSGLALCSGFALNSRALRALDSGFTLNFRLGTLNWPPKINSWIRPWCQMFQARWSLRFRSRPRWGAYDCFPKWNPLIVGFDKKLCSGDASMTQGESASMTFLGGDRRPYRYPIIHTHTFQMLKPPQSATPHHIRHTLYTEKTTNPHCASYPSMTPCTSISPSSVPSSSDFADLLS